MSTKVAPSIQAAEIIRRLGFKVVSPITDRNYIENVNVTAGTDELYFANNITKEQISGAIYIGFEPFRIKIADPDYSTIAILHGYLKVQTSMLSPNVLHLYGDPDDTVNQLITALARWTDDLKVQKSAEKTLKIFYRAADTE